MLRLLLLSCLLIGASDKHQFEKDFLFKQPRKTRLERMREYSLEDQYKIYRYGHDNIEPPALYLATPIAEKGGAAIPFLIKQLESDNDDLAARDILYLLERMHQMDTFDAQQDSALMKILDARIAAIKNKNAQDSSRDMLQHIKGSPYKTRKRLN